MIDNIYNVSPQQIRYIIELNITGSFQGASKKCFVTQPTLSMQIKKVEDLLGFVLFDRSKNPVQMTPYGKKLLPILLDIQKEYSRINTLKQKLEGKFLEQVRIGIIPTISSYLLLDLYQKMVGHSEEIQIIVEEFKTEELTAALAENKVDVGIMAGPYQETGMRTVPLYVEEILIYFPEFKKDIITPLDLDEIQPWLLSQGNCLRTQMVNFCKIDDQVEQGEVKWSYQGGNIDLLIDMVDLNGGYTLVPEFYRIPKIKLRRLWDDISNEFPAREVIAVFPNKSYNKEPIEDIIRLIQLTYGKKSHKNLRVLNWK